MLCYTHTRSLGSNKQLAAKTENIDRFRGTENAGPAFNYCNVAPRPYFILTQYNNFNQQTSLIRGVV